jgi:putative phage-type endonuclease
MPEFICAADDPQWHAERRKGITATDLPVILGLASWASPYSLWAEKSGITDPAPDSDRFRLGRVLEGYVLTRWREETGDETPGLRARLWRGSRPWQLATTDLALGIDRDRDHPGRQFQPESVVEVKSWADMDRHAWDDGPPPAVRAQILWQMDVMDVARGHWGVLFLPSGEFRHGTIDHDESPVREYPHDIPGPLAESICRACGDIAMMRSAARDFLDLIDLGTPPDVDGSAATLAALRARFTPAEGPAAEVDESLWIDFTEAKAAKSRAETDVREREAKIREIIGTATRIKVDGKIAGRRITATAQVKAHERRQDYLRAVNAGGNGDE